ncbi:MAG: hypothetical protein JSU87_03160 [Gemmatimonadota bacterium]|nr:MAG: hypothetical protein JSU87_03160 [Gemmatimonadota bacterium]
MGTLGRILKFYMDESELSDQGFVLEANRQFFHPLGLYLVLQITEDGYRLRVLDYRERPAGVRFEGERDADECADRRGKVANVGALWEERAERRLERYGYIVQPSEELYSPGVKRESEEDGLGKPEFFDA